MPEFAPVFNVSALNGTNGFRLDGASAGDYSGWSAAGADVSGDGRADLLIGAPFSETGGLNRGLAYVVFGRAANPAALSLATRVAGGTAYRFQGEAAQDHAGFSIANAGDVNGDGRDDLIIGAHLADPDAALGDRGASYLVFGGAANFEALDQADGTNDNQILLANLTPARGYRFDGAANGDASGFSVAGAGDMDGDGFADLIIGAPYADPDAGSSNGASFILFGGITNLNDIDDDDSTVDGRIDLAQISAGIGVRLDGAKTFPNEQSGRSVAGVGDVNGDGFDDAIIGARYADPNGANDDEGAAYLVFGRANAAFPSTLDLSSLNGLQGTRLDGIAADDLAGEAVNGAGDVNGDGLDDLVIGARFADPGGSDSGSAYVVFGRSAWGASLDLSGLNGQNGFRLDGIRDNDWTGFSVTGTGDVNGDGFADLLVGALQFDRLGAYEIGAAFVVFGRAGGFPAVLNLASLDGDDGFRIEGAAEGDKLARGSSIGPAGDVNGDGFDDILIAAPYADNGADASGSTYVIYGHRANTAVNRTGTELANRINGGKGSDTVKGLDGSDTLLGWEGDDSVHGGDGNDTIFASAGDDTLLGGGGNDTISGAAYDDSVAGGSGGDYLLMNAGEDTVYGNSGFDILDLAGLGAAVTVNLAAKTATLPGLSTLTFGGIEALAGTTGADSFTGNLAANSFFGRIGNDTLSGGAGNDTLTGGPGADRLTGSFHADRFDFNAVSETPLAGFDTITDFTKAQGDRIDLSGIDAIAGGANNAFAFIGTAAFTAPGQVRAVQSGASTLVLLNTTGPSGAEAEILLANFTAATLAAADFVL